MEDLFEVGVVKAVGDAVRAKQKSVAWFNADGTHLRFDKLMTAPQRFLQDVTSRMGFGLPFVDLTISVEPTDIGVIFRNLFDPSRGR